MFAAIKKRLDFKSQSSAESSKGVVSLEACIVLPIFILTIMFFYGLIIMFLGQNTIAHAMVQSAESLSLDAFASEKIAGDLGSMDEENSEQLLIAVYGELFTEQDGYFATSEKWQDGESEDIEKVVKNRFLAYLVGSGGNIDSKADKLLSFLNVEGNSTVRSLVRRAYSPPEFSVIPSQIIRCFMSSL